MSLPNPDTELLMSERVPIQDEFPGQDFRVEFGESAANPRFLDQGLSAPTVCFAVLSDLLPSTLDVEDPRFGLLERRDGSNDFPSLVDIAEDVFSLRDGVVELRNCR